MAELNNDHERRISTIEGEMKSLATKADLAEFKVEIMDYIRTEVQSAIRAQTEEFRSTFDQFGDTLNRQNEELRRHGGEIRELREKESRFRGAVDTLKYALPFLISIIAVLVAVLK
ncbi:MAG: hypothetical protein F4X02_11405 [Chloroflexi bacterium]|nr:hypothetical protein [Chloroflexota bacterium]